MTTQRGAPRIPPVSSPDEAQREILAKAPTRPDGTHRNIFLTFAHHPLLLQRFNAFAGTFMRFGKLSPYERELLVLRVAGRVGSRYEYCQHLQIARDAGLDDGTIMAALSQPGAPPLSPADRLLVTAADELLDTGDVGEETWSALAERYEPAALLELLFTIGLYRITGEILNTVGVQLEDEPDLAIDWGYAERSEA
jgi:alkylhydroperoxidase family enzyme